jgi:hypothetical protein
MSQNELAPAEWWNAQRPRYNLGLSGAAGISFVAYSFLGSIVYRHDAEFEITVFSLFFMALAFFMMMVVANLCYSLGALSESLVRPRNPGTYRRWCFRFGFGISVLVPLSVPGAVLLEGIFG